MDCEKVGRLIREVRLEKGMTQKNLADAMNISDRAVSKWERGAGCPDVSLLKELSRILNVNIEKILSGDLEPNRADGGNMKRIKFYLCPVCGNLTCCTGGSEVSCCGRKLAPIEVHQGEEDMGASVGEIDGDYFVSARHDMTKEHFISFAAYVCYDSVMLVKLYPEQSAEVRFPKMRKGDIYLCCSRHGLYKVN